MSNKDNGAINTPRPALPANWLDSADFQDFNEYDRTYAFQIVQNLEGLTAEKAIKLFNFLAINKGLKI